MVASLIRPRRSVGGLTHWLVPTDTIFPQHLGIGELIRVDEAAHNALVACVGPIDMRGRNRSPRRGDRHADAGMRRTIRPPRRRFSTD